MLRLGVWYIIDMETKGGYNMRPNRLELVDDGIRFRRVYLNGTALGEMIYNRERRRWEMWELPIDRPNPLYLNYWESVADLAYNYDAEIIKSS